LWWYPYLGGQTQLPLQGSIDLDIETQNVLSGVVEIKTQITLLEQKRDELRGKFTESHPTVIAIDKQIVRLQAQMNKVLPIV